MESESPNSPKPKPAVDPGLELEKELTCSICTELLYRPLTALDCLHTFCGACLKEWFSWQAAAAEQAPSPPAPGAPVFTCPACRAPVRDTRPNATVVTLLDLLLAAQPAKQKPAGERAEMDAKYRPGEAVLPRLRFLERSPDQARLDEEDRRLLAEVQERSRREAVAGPAARSRAGSRQGEVEDADVGGGDGGRRERRHRAEQSVMLQPEGSSSERRRRGHRSGERQGSRESSRSRRGPLELEHQSSLRSLIGSSHTGSMDVEREIEEFARQIQEEGLLEGLDLENLDLDNDDELSRRIQEAYRRRQREREQRERDRPRREGPRRSNASETAPPEQTGSQTGLHTTTRSSGERRSEESRRGPSSRSTSRQRSHSHSNSRSSSATRQAQNVTWQSETGNRPPISNHGTHLLPDSESHRQRRRTSSEVRSATVPVSPRQGPVRVEARSQTDLALRSMSGEPSMIPAALVTPGSTRPIISDGRSSSSPTMSSAPQLGSSTGGQPPRATRAAPPASSPQSSPQTTPAAGTATAATFETHARRALAARPLEPIPGPRSNFASISPVDDPSSPAQSRPSGHQRRGSQFYKEPSVSCARCAKEHIEYEVHYNCGICSHGEYNLCLACYRAGKGCHHWFGFGNAAWQKWEARRAAAGPGAPELAPPHMLTAGRYLPPRSAPGGADGRRTLTAENPAHRLQTGTFCVRCFAWTNDCYWRCESCNDADWGFCNDCVNQGRCCTHPLLPLAYYTHHEAQPQPQPQPGSPPTSPRSPGRPLSASLSRSADAAVIGAFKALTFTTTCDVCRIPIPPAQDRYHCYACTSSLPAAAPSKPGDYDVCSACYARLAARGDVAAENGPAGWRRCPQAGHRMVVVGFAEGRGGQRRRVVRDLVGGRTLMIEEVQGAEHLQRWFVSFGGEKRHERLVARDVRETAPVMVAGAAGGGGGGGGAGPAAFPPDGGLGARAVARWAWYPAEGAEDELLFPKAAEIREIEDVNGEWFHGVYMGAKGLFPAGYLCKDGSGG